MAKPEWWNDEGLKALSARVLRALLNHSDTNRMRAEVLSGLSGAWEVGHRSAAELEEAATHFERAAALHSAPAAKEDFKRSAETCRRRAEICWAEVLSGPRRVAWEGGRGRSAAELKEAATCYERAAALCDAPARKAELAHDADGCRSQADAMITCNSCGIVIS